MVEKLSTFTISLPIILALSLILLSISILRASKVKENSLIQIREFISEDKSKANLKILLHKQPVVRQFTVAR